MSDTEDTGTLDDVEPLDGAGDDDEEQGERLRAWLTEGRTAVQSCLARARVAHGGVSATPAWTAAPMLAVWTVRSRGGTGAGAVGWWAVAGDVPTDYVAAHGVPDARHALAAFAARWCEVADQMARGDAADPAAGPAEWRALGTLLRRRADTLARWAGDESAWPEDERRP